jgi:hypothetical protein
MGDMIKLDLQYKNWHAIISTTPCKAFSFEKNSWAGVGAGHSWFFSGGRNTLGARDYPERGHYFQPLRLQIYIGIPIEQIQ